MQYDNIMRETTQQEILGQVKRLTTAFAAIHDDAVSALQSARSAAASAERAELAAVRQPYPNSLTGTWWVWNADAAQYEDTGLPYSGTGKTETYVHTQSAASDTWDIVHGLEKYPSVTVVDSGGNVVMGNVKHVDENHLVVTFSAVFSGKAYLN